jgi:hypothetical protein
MTISFAIEHPDRLVDGTIEVVWTRESLVSEMMLLQIAPEFFDVVELRRVFRQPFDREPGCPRGECGARRLAGVDRAVVEDEHDWLRRMIRRRAILRVDLLQKRDEIATALAPAGAHDQVTRRPVEQTEHRHLGGLAGRWNAQIRTLLGPGMGQIGMGERVRLIPEQEHDIPPRPAPSGACGAGQRGPRLVRPGGPSGYGAAGASGNPLLAQHHREP